MIQKGFLSLWRGQDSNLRPSGYEPDELPAAPPRDIELRRYRLYHFNINTNLILFYFTCLMLSYF